ncbi:hypothetical protein AB1Y20_016780 [Prymnesium parvum]|uniref:Uncharacterized protein n=1 Tax=Prymnesium parvum TaxID=97485 RepID=A0AB34I9V6_PRYPA
MASVYDALEYVIATKLPEEFLKKDGRKRKCAVRKAVGCVKGKHRLEDFVPKLKTKLLKDYETTKDDRYRDLHEEIPDYESSKNGPFMTFIKERKILEQYEKRPRRKANKRKRKDEKAPCEANVAAKDAVLKELEGLAAVKRKREEAPLPTEVQCIAECEVLAEIIRQKLSALPAESIKQALESLDMLALDLEGLKAVASAFPLATRSRDGLFPREPSAPKEPPSDGVGQHEAEPRHEQSPACTSNELPRTNGSARKEEDTDRVNNCPPPSHPELSGKDADESFPLIEDLPERTVPQLPAGPLDALELTNGSAREDDDTDRVNDCPPLSPVSELSEEPWPPVGSPELTLPQSLAGPSDALLATNGSDGVSHSPDELSAQSEEARLGAKSQEECGTDGTLASAEVPDGSIDSFLDDDLFLS